MLSERFFFVTERISDLSSLELQFQYNTKDGVKMLERELWRMHRYLRDVERSEEQQLDKRFCPEISAIADNAEDILDGLMSDKSPSNPIGCQIRALTQRIEGFFKAISAKPNYNFNTGNNINIDGQQTTGSISVYVGVNTPTAKKRAPWRQSYGHVENSDVVGFHQETKTLLNQLLQHDQTRVVGIVGMAGLGKTTLAKQLYHHSDIKNHFIHRVWICVSQSWNRRDILYEIIRQILGLTGRGDAVQSWSDEDLFRKVDAILKKDRYLVVLDDIWTVEAWNEIAPAFPIRRGSKVLVTTRNGGVPKQLDPAFFVLQPEPLNELDSWTLFCKRIYNKDTPFSCEDQGKEMVKKCKGLPLAITTLAGALRVHNTPIHWRRFNQALTKNIMKSVDSSSLGVVKEVLALSYQDLPNDLKAFFLYLRLFPEDFEIRVGMLMKIWIAEGLIAQSLLFEEQTEAPLLEEEAMLVAGEYLDALTHRYLIQDVKRNYMGRVKTFQMHDLIREMCNDKAKEAEEFHSELRRFSLCFTSTQGPQLNKRCSEILASITSSAKSSHLRSLIFINSMPSELLALYTTPLCESFKLLRVIIFWGVRTPCLTLPEAMGNLIHLRYIGVRYSCIPALPKSIGNWQKLLTLDFRSDWASGGPLENVWKLKSLRHLYFPSYYIDESPENWKLLKLDELENLQTLWYVRGGDWMLSELAGLSPTLQKLYILRIPSREHLEALLSPRVKFENLKTLKLRWTYHGVQMQEMQPFKHCKNLQKLVLYGKIQESKTKPLLFSPNLQNLELQYTELKAPDLMTVLGNTLPRLKVLFLGKDAYKRTKMTSTAGSFPQLEYLKFKELRNLKLWTIEPGAMPCLKELVLVRCKKLSRFPEGWRLVSVPPQVSPLRMSRPFNESLQQWREQHAELLNSLPVRPQFEEPYLEFRRWVTLKVNINWVAFVLAFFVVTIGIWKAQNTI